MVQLTSNYSVVPNNTIKLFRRKKRKSTTDKKPYFPSKNINKCKQTETRILEYKDANLTMMNMFCMFEETLRLGPCHKRNGSHNKQSKCYLGRLIFANLPGFRTTQETDVWARLGRNFQRVLTEERRPILNGQPHARGWNAGPNKQEDSS